MVYTSEQKEAVIQKMLPPHGKSIRVLSQEEGIGESTLYSWRQAARAQGRLLPDSDTSPEGWNVSDKFAAVLETAAMNEAELSEYCRRKGGRPGKLQ